MSFWDIVRPPVDDVMNLVTNPSFETGSTANWLTFGTGASIYYYTPGYFGRWKLRLLTGTDYYSSAYTNVYFNRSSGGTYYLTAWVYCSVPGTPCRLFFKQGGNLYGITTFTATGDWQRVETSHTVGGSGVFEAHIGFNNASGSQMLYVDGVMVQSYGPNMTYIDGDQPGCYWQGQVGLSKSILRANDRNGGQYVDLDTVHFAVQEWSGVGMPLPSNVMVRYGLGDGSYYQRTTMQPRSIVLTGVMNVQDGASLNSLLTNRDALIDLINPLPQPQGPFILRFRGGTSRNLICRAVYEAGLEMNYAAARGFTETLGLTLTCPDPYWYEESDQSVDNIDTVAFGGGTPVPVAYVLSRMKTLETSFGRAAGYNVQKVLWNPVKSEMYIGGYFATLSGISITNIARWDYNAMPASGLTGFGTGTDGTVMAIACTSDGTMYIGGQFTLANGVTVNKVTYWNGSTFVAMGVTPGVDGDVFSIAPVSIPSYNGIVVGGAFNNAGGSPMAKIAVWNGITWGPLGSGLNGTCRCVAVGPDGNIYAGGDFTVAGGVTTTGIARWNTTTTTWEALGTGLNGSCYCMAWGKDGNLYIGGSFTTAGGITCNRVAMWNGAQWQPLGPGFDGIIYAIGTDLDDGTIYALGAFTKINTVSTRAFASWNGSSWGLGPMNQNVSTLTGASISVHPISHRIAFSVQGTDAGTQWMSYFVSSGTGSGVTLLDATGMTYMKLDFIGPGIIHEVRNLLTGDSIRTTAILVTGETAHMIFEPGQFRFYSESRGDLLSTVLPGSDQLRFHLGPRAWMIAAKFVSVDGTGVGAAVKMVFRRAYLSIDGAG